MYSKISNPMDYRVALYIRLSKEDDREAESQSVTNQRSILLDFTQKNKLPVHDTYVDDGFSGTSFDRPAFNRLLEDIEAKKVNMVITKDMSRLGRDYIQTGYERHTQSAARFAIGNERRVILMNLCVHNALTPCRAVLAIHPSKSALCVCIGLNLPQ